MSRDVAGIVFDKDGTLFDFHATWSHWAAEILADEARGDAARLAGMAAALDYDLDERRFRPGSVAVAGTVDEIVDALAPWLGAEPRANVIHRFHARAALAPQVEAIPLAPFLRDLGGRGLMLGVATNDGEGPARAHLDAVGVSRFFDFIAGADSGHGAKPGPGQLLAFAEACALAPARCVMVGDSTHDLAAARAAGMTAVGVLTGLATEADLAPLADVVLPSIAHISAWLDA